MKNPPWPSSEKCIGCGAVDVLNFWNVVPFRVTAAAATYVSGAELCRNETATAPLSFDAVQSQPWFPTPPICAGVLHVAPPSEEEVRNATSLPAMLL